jgi:hypothetical protein
MGYVQYNYDAGTSLQWYEFTMGRVYCVPDALDTKGYVQYNYDAGTSLYWYDLTSCGTSVQWYELTIKRINKVAIHGLKRRFYSQLVIHVGDVARLIH